MRGTMQHPALMAMTDAAVAVLTAGADGRVRHGEKNIYDSFPAVSVVFSGSSSLSLIKGSYDLSRRAAMYRLAGLSFREYLNLKTGVDHPLQ